MWIAQESKYNNIINETEGILTVFQPGLSFKF